MSPEARRVLSLANDRFLDYMRERHYPNEQAVLDDLMGATTAGTLIRAVAEWRIASGGAPQELSE